MMSMLNAMYIYAMCRFNAFKEEEKGAVDIVAIVVMVGIAVLLAVLFRGAIEDLLDSLFGTITSNATNAVN